MTATRSGDILPVNNPFFALSPRLCSSSHDFATPSLRRFPRRGRVTRRDRVKTHVENTCAVEPHGCSRADPLLYPAVDGFADPPKRKTRRFEGKTLRCRRFCANGFGECSATNVSSNVLFGRERGEDRSGSSKGFATKQFEERILSLFFFLSRPVNRCVGLASCKISQFLSFFLLVDEEERRVTSGIRGELECKEEQRGERQGLVLFLFGKNQWESPCNTSWKRRFEREVWEKKFSGKADRKVSGSSLR